LWEIKNQYRTLRLSWNDMSCQNIWKEKGLCSVVLPVDYVWCREAMLSHTLIIHHFLDGLYDKRTRLLENSFSVCASSATIYFHYLLFCTSLSSFLLHLVNVYVCPTSCYIENTHFWQAHNECVGIYRDLGIHNPSVCFSSLTQLS
jgi:hypothetical protein